MRVLNTAILVIFATMTAFAQVGKLLPCEVRSSTEKKRVGLVLRDDGPANLTPSLLFQGHFGIDQIELVHMSEKWSKDLREGRTDELVPLVMCTLRLDYLVTGTLTYKFWDSDVSGMQIRSCGITFRFKVFNSKGNVVSNQQIGAPGAGFTDDGAMEVAVDHTHKMFMEMFFHKFLK